MQIHNKKSHIGIFINLHGKNKHFIGLIMYFYIIVSVGEIFLYSPVSSSFYSYNDSVNQAKM